VLRPVDWDSLRRTRMEPGTSRPVKRDLAAPRRASRRRGAVATALLFGPCFSSAGRAEESGAPRAEDPALVERVVALENSLADTQALLLERRNGVSVNGYVDFGFFVTTGNGTGFVQDQGPLDARRFPQYANQFGWVFLGDLLAPAVNSRGEPADLGEVPGVNRYDSLASGGRPTFAVNEVNLTLQGALAESALVTASFDFLPRSGTDFRLGDVFEVDRAELEWLPGRARKTSIFFGKMESVIGIEYRDRKANQRFGITPSLIARYTTGTPLGLKVRSKFGPDDELVIAVALTNGSSTTETFHFYDEIDSNAGKTASGRLSLAPWRRWELGVSGSYGAQDHARDSHDPLWFFGVDLQLHLPGVEVKGQWLVGHDAGETGRVYSEPHRPYGLALNAGAYVEIDTTFSSGWGLLLRGDLRDARVWLGDAAQPGGADRIYITKGWRATAGLRFQPTERIIVKAEGLHNGEYGGIPAISDDVLTSSLLLIY